MWKRLTLIMAITAFLAAGIFLATVAFGQPSLGLVYHQIQIVDETGEPVTDIEYLDIYTVGTTTSQTIYKERGKVSAITLPMEPDAGTTNSTLLSSDGTAYWWGPPNYDYSVTDSNNTAVNADHRARTPSDGQIIFPSYLLTISSSAYLDAQSVTFGTSLDWVFNAGTTADRLTLTPATDGAAMYVGNTTYTSDLNLWGATANYDLMWDASLNTLSFRDNAILGFGCGTLGGAVDYKISTAGSTGNLVVTAVTADDAVEFGDGTIATDVVFQNTTTATADIRWDDATETWTWGVTNYGVDVKFWADTASMYAIWDESIDTLSFVTSNIKLDDGSILYLGTKTSAATKDGDVTLQFDGTNLELFATAIDTPFAIGGTTTNGFDITYYFETAGQLRTDYDADFINLTDDMELRFGTGASSDGDIKISSNSTNVLQIEQVALDTGTIEIGVDNRDIPIKWYAETASSYFQLTGDDVNIEAMNLALGDGDSLLFGDSLGTGDFSITDTSDVLVIDVVAAGTGTIAIGNDADDVPLTWYAETTNCYFKLTGDDVHVEGMSLCLGDSDQLQFGDALGTGDIKIYATGTDLIIDGVVAETGTVAIGVTNLGLDFKLWAATDAEGILWDASDEALEFTGANLTLNAASILTLGQTVNADVVVTTGTYTVLVANSGKVHVIPDLAGATSIDLPAEADGLYYKFIYVGGADEAHTHTIDSENDTNYFIGGVAFADTDAGDAADEINAGVYSDGNSNSKFAIVNASAGTIVEVHCDGTNWYITGQVFSATVPTFADQ